MSCRLRRDISVCEKIAVGSEGGVEGGNPASPEPKRSPAALLVQSRARRKNFLCFFEFAPVDLFLLKGKRNFSARHASGASGGGAERQFRSKKFRAKFRISHHENKQISQYANGKYLKLSYFILICLLEICSACSIFIVSTEEG